MFYIKNVFTQGSIVGAICALILTLFIGVGSIVEGNAGNLSNQKLPLRTDGCYLNESLGGLIESTNWKDIEYSGMNNLLGISYLWQPAIPVCGSIIFGLIFSIIYRLFRKQGPVKAKYMTPIIVSLWQKILSEKTFNDWIETEPILNIKYESNEPNFVYNNNNNLIMDKTEKNA